MGTGSNLKPVAKAHDRWRHPWESAGGVWISAVLRQVLALGSGNQLRAFLLGAHAHLPPRKETVASNVRKRLTVRTSQSTRGLGSSLHPQCTHLDSPYPLDSPFFLPGCTSHQSLGTAPSWPAPGSLPSQEGSSCSRLIQPGSRFHNVLLP